jgi:hypothetical protein
VFNNGQAISNIDFIMTHEVLCIGKRNGYGRVQINNSKKIWPRKSPT